MEFHDEIKCFIICKDEGYLTALYSYFSIDKFNSLVQQSLKSTSKDALRIVVCESHEMEGLKEQKELCKHEKKNWMDCGIFGIVVVSTKSLNFKVLRAMQQVEEDNFAH